MLQAVNYEDSASRGRCSQFDFGGCPGALGKLASKGMFRALLGSSWPGGHKLILEDENLRYSGAAAGP